MSNSKFKIAFSAGHCRGAMGLIVRSGQNFIAEFSSVPDHPWNVEFDVALPVRLTFEVWGKDMHDTLVDDRGGILQDKFVRIDGLMIDRVWVKKWLLESRLIQFYPTGDTMVLTNYLGKNGQAVLEITHDNSLDFMLDLTASD